MNSPNPKLIACNYVGKHEETACNEIRPGPVHCSCNEFPLPDPANSPLHCKDPGEGVKKLIVHCRVIRSSGIATLMGRGAVATRRWPSSGTTPATRRRSGRNLLLSMDDPPESMRGHGGHQHEDMTGWGSLDGFSDSYARFAPGSVQ